MAKPGIDVASIPSFPSDLTPGFQVTVAGKHIGPVFTDRSQAEDIAEWLEQSWREIQTWLES